MLLVPRFGAAGSNVPFLCIFLLFFLILDSLRFEFRVLLFPPSVHKPYERSRLA